MHIKIGCGNCEEDGVSSCLVCDSDDAKFQPMTHDEIITQVWKPNSNENNSESDERWGDWNFLK